MGSISDYLENKLLDHVTGVAAYTPPATVYVGLSTADPQDDGSGLAEPSGNNYGRKAVTLGAAASRQVKNSALITFNQASGAWGTVSHYGIFDAETGGNMMAHGSLSESKQVVAGNTPSIAAEAIVLSFNAGAIFTYLANKLLDLAFRNQAYSQPSIHVALSTTTPNDDGTGVTEPSGNNYARKAHSSWAAASGGASSNSGAVSLNTPSGSWGTITDAVIYDALSSGNALLRGDVTDQAVGTGDTVSFPDGDIDISLS